MQGIIIGRMPPAAVVASQASSCQLGAHGYRWPVASISKLPVQTPMYGLLPRAVRTDFQRTRPPRRGSILAKSSHKANVVQEDMNNGFSQFTELSTTS